MVVPVTIKHGYVLLFDAKPFGVSLDRPEQA